MCIRDRSTLGQTRPAPEPCHQEREAVMNVLHSSNRPKVSATATVRGHEKVPAGGHQEVPAGGQVKVPPLARRVEPEHEPWTVTVAVSSQSPHRPGSSIEVCEGPNDHHCRLSGRWFVPWRRRDLRDDAQDRQAGYRTSTGRGRPPTAQGPGP